jgi:zeaxanthin glucosyltransferase
MKLLVVSPDYASHAVPLIQLATAWRDTAGEVVFATGQATRSLVERAGLEWIELRLGKGHNAGVVEVGQQPVGEDDHLRAFFDATRAGPVATLLYQADARRHDLLHDPDRVLDRLSEIISHVNPDRVVVDHVAFGARLALRALGIEPATVVLGHPSALPAPGEVYGLPPEWPMSMRPSQADLDVLTERCCQSVDDLQSAADEVIGRRAPRRLPVGDLTSVPGVPTIYSYPEALHHPDRCLPANHVFIGSLTRTETMGDLHLPSGSGPRVTVALGSFLSARDDVLATAVSAAHAGAWRLALAHGSTPIERLGPLPEGAVVERHLPQVALLEHTDVFINHGGNGSVTEAAAVGVPMVVLPFSTDQFAGAAAIERAGLGRAMAPNGLDSDALVSAVDEVLRSGAVERAQTVARSIAGHGGPLAAVAAIVEQGLPVR